LAATAMSHVRSARRARRSAMAHTLRATPSAYAAEPPRAHMRGPTFMPFPSRATSLLTSGWPLPPAPGAGSLHPSRSVMATKAAAAVLGRLDQVRPGLEDFYKDLHAH